MLLKFSVRNFRSIGETEELSLVASSLSDNDAGLIDIPNQKFKVLPSAVIYGANASGKSNMLKALKLFRDGVVASYRSPPGKIMRNSFALGESSDEDTSQYEADFLIKNDEDGKSFTRMTYGFIISDQRVMEEWLYAYPKQHRQVWFHRNHKEETEYYFGKELKGQNRVVAQATKQNALFLSTAFANNHAQLTPIYNFFDDFMFNLHGLTSEDEETMAMLFGTEQEQITSVILDFLKDADVGICEAKLETVKATEKQNTIATEIREVLARHLSNPENIRSSFDKDERTRVKLGHKGKNDVVYFPLDDESTGTVAFLNLIGLAFTALGSGSLLIVDELDASLHPLLCKKILELFNSSRSNPYRGQLIFSTHDTTLLTNDLFRRDQIWFAQKSEGLSKFYPLSDLKLRKGDNLQKGYLEGKFGAIPYLGDFKSLVGG